MLVCLLLGPISCPVFLCGKFLHLGDNFFFKNEYFVIIFFLKKKKSLKQEGKFGLYKKCHLFSWTAPFVVYLRIEKKTIFMATALSINGENLGLR
jgi:hypothetical protein